MALRFTLASSSDWPPDRNVTPEKKIEASTRPGYLLALICCYKTFNGAYQTSHYLEIILILVTLIIHSLAIHYMHLIFCVICEKKTFLKKKDRI